MGAPTTSLATTILSTVELPALVEESERAILVEVLSVRYGYDDNRLPSTFLSLRIEEQLYGPSLSKSTSHEIKLFGAPVEMKDGLNLFVDGTPRYRAGQRYLLLLLRESPLGFTNTAGLTFGAFSIRANRNGAIRAVAPGENHSLDDLRRKLVTLRGQQP